MKIRGYCVGVVGVTRSEVRSGGWESLGAGEVVADVKPID